MWYCQVLAGIGGAVAYYILRYDRREDFTFMEYARVELMALVKGVVSFLFIWGCWSVLNRYEFTPFALPELPAMSPALALFIGFAGKKLGEYTLGKLKQFG